MDSRYRKHSSKERVAATFLPDCTGRLSTASRTLDNRGLTTLVSEQVPAANHRWKFDLRTQVGNHLRPIIPNVTNNTAPSQAVRSAQ
jgi:hypothetical protein